MNQLQAFEEKTLKSLPTFGQIPSFRAGDTLKVYVRVTEGAKERTQVFEGACIARKNRGLHSSFRVRKLLAGEWVERLFPLYSPLIKIERLREGVVRRAKLYYLRGREGKAARIRSKLPKAKTVLLKNKTPGAEKEAAASLKSTKAEAGVKKAATSS